MTGFVRSLDRRRKSIPSYRLHKPSGRAVATFAGRDYYLGPFGSEESRIRYSELITQHLSGASVDPFKGGHSSDNLSNEGLTINELVLGFMHHAKIYYLKNGQPTSEIGCFKLALKPLIELYGPTAANEFGPLSLKALRQIYVEKGWVRSSVNRAVGRIRQVFKWGVENELVRPTTLQKLQAVPALLAGRTVARDNEPRTSVADQEIKAVQAIVSPLVCDLIELQRLIGARSGELLSLTEAMIDRREAVWTAKLDDHKNAHHGQQRSLAIGPKAQQVLMKYFSGDREKRLFAITRTAYCRAITRACKRLKIPRWVPHQLRHTTGDHVRDVLSLDHAQAVLGHAKISTSEHYAKLRHEKAKEAASQVG